MRTKLELDDAQVARANLLTDNDDITALVHEALRALIERDSGRRLTRLGGTEPE
jgi:Arc/MetJ family transcription regulator